MSWQVGDLAVCVTLTHPAFPKPSSRLVLGKVYTVEQIGRPHGNLAGDYGLRLREVQTRVPGNGFVQSLFRKILPDKHEQCEPEFVTLLKRIKVHETASDWLERVGPIAKRLNLESQFDTRQTLKEGDK